MLSKELQMRATTDQFFGKMMADYQKSGSTNKQAFIRQYDDAVRKAKDKTDFTRLSHSSLRKMMDFYTDPFAKIEAVHGRPFCKD